MVLLCSGSALDLDRINGYKPDGERAYCRFAAATHKLKNVPEKDYGHFVQAEDGGIIYHSDIAFKLLFDLSARARLENVKYILRECARSAEIKPDGEYRLTRPNAKRPLGSLLAQYKIRNVLLPDDSRIVPHNLKALSEYDMVNMLCARAQYHNPEYSNACMDAIGFLGDYIFLGKATKSMMHLHKALTELLDNIDTDTFKIFVEDFYERIDRIPAEKYGIEAKQAAKAMDEDDYDPEARNNTDAIEEEKQKAQEILEADAKLDEMFSHKLRRVSGADITGLDATYTSGYCEGMYTAELMNADSENFLEQLIIARANNGAAPIDLLSEAISREHAKDNPANMLRKHLEDIRGDIEDTLGEDAINEPVIGENIITDDGSDNFGKEPDSDNSAEPAVIPEEPAVNAPSDDELNGMFPDEDSLEDEEDGGEELPEDEIPFDEPDGDVE